MSQLAEKTENMTPNRLISLKVLVFFFFGALQCMYAFLPYHMQALGFTLYDIRLVTLISALISIIGPLIIGFILDRLTIKRPAAYGKWLRIFLFIFFILAGLMFGSLLLLSPSTPGDESEISVTFSCNDHGGFVYIRKNVTDGHCKSLEGLHGGLKLFNCSYTCETPENFNYFSQQSDINKNLPERIVNLSNGTSSENIASEYDDYPDVSDSLPEPASLIQAAPTQSTIIPPPHICLNNTKDGHCHVYITGSEIKMANMTGAKLSEDQTNQFNEEWCKHPLEYFSCHVPQNQIKFMEIQRLKDNLSCTPAVECHISDPYDEDSILHYIERTTKYSGVPVPYEEYVTLRIIAEIFPAIIHMLLNVAIIVATRENSSGRGNIGNQWAFYPIGVLVFASIIGLINHSLPLDIDNYIVPIAVFAISMFICAVVVLFSGKLPLTPSDWWWYTKCGMLVIPMSALKRYKWIIAVITIISFILGGLWHIQEAYRHLFTVDLIEYAIVGDGIWRSKSFVYIFGAILAIPLIWNGEKIVSCFGHSNIFILAFVSFALRFAGLYFDSVSSLTTLYELFEPLSFYLPWLAVILFTRHLIPKRFLAIGQGLVVILFFALGRGIGFFYGTSIIADDRDNQNIWKSPKDNREAELNDLQTIHTVAATIACIAAIIYFTVYHCILLPYYRVPNKRLATSTDSNVSPQHVFHDERSRKGYFRY